MQRELFDYVIAKETPAGLLGIREGIRLECFNDPKPRSVKAIRYGTGLIIHSSFVNADRGLKTDYYWTVAHEPTGFAIVKDVPKRIARHLAGVLSELPINWTPTTQETFISGFKSLSQPLQQLVHQIRKEDYSKAA